jgi:hypothetical protein
MASASKLFSHKKQFIYTYMLFAPNRTGMSGMDNHVSI